MEKGEKKREEGVGGGEGEGEEIAERIERR